jgi:hypothetical protein
MVTFLRHGKDVEQDLCLDTDSNEAISFDSDKDVNTNKDIDTNSVYDKDSATVGFASWSQVHV